MAALTGLMNRSNVIVISLLGLSLLVGAVEFRLNSIGEYMTEQSQTVWSLVFVILTVMWAIDDSKRQSFDAPFDFGLLMYGRRTRVPRR